MLSPEKGKLSLLVELLSSILLILATMESRYYYPHFIDEEIELHRD